jgi:two-component system response regulator FlrC
MQRAAILCAGEEVGAEHLHLTPGAETAWAAEFAAEPVPVSGVRQGEAASPDSAGESLPAANMKNLEREHILATLKAVNGSRKLAVERLGISERTLRYKLKQYREEGLYDETP